MFKHLLFLLLISLTNYALSMSASELLAKSDTYRTPYDNPKIDISIEEYSGDTISKNNTYTVFHRDGESLVNILSGANKGNRVLLSDKGMYLATKRASRPVRITPIQRLLGQASYGDLAGIRFVDDYNAKILEEQQDAIVLELIASNKKSTYYKILLWIDNKEYYPIKAEAYLKSGKLYKKMAYIIEDSLVRTIRYTSPDIPNKKTLMNFNAIIDKKLPKRFYTSHGMRGNIN